MAICERPILMSAPMVRAILDGNKTQTRRIIKPQPEEGTDCPYHIGIGNDRRSRVCPYGVPGDRLWVREKCRAEEMESGLYGVRYLADMDFREIKNTPEASDDWLVLNNYRGQSGAMVPSIHMPRWASRINLEIVGTLVERLQDISAEGAIAEGLTDCGGAWAIKTEKMTSRCVDPIDTFRDLWEHINGYGSWNKKPWVWVVEFNMI